MILMDDIVRDGNATLRKVAEEIELPISEDIRELGKKMMEYLENSQDPEIGEELGLRGGVGLAAPQVDVSKRIVALLVPNEEDDPTKAPLFKEVLVNPKVISHSEKKLTLPMGEGCLSVDEDIDGYVPRAKRITLQYYDLDNKLHEIRLKGYPAIVVQHEIDHINGVLYYDHINQEDPHELDNKTSVL